MRKELLGLFTIFDAFYPFRLPCKLMHSLFYRGGRISWWRTNNLGQFLNRVKSQSHSALVTVTRDGKLESSSLVDHYLIFPSQIFHSIRHPDGREIIWGSKALQLFLQNMHLEPFRCAPTSHSNIGYISYAPQLSAMNHAFHYTGARYQDIVWTQSCH
jgi:hypothetical protein